jgi:hypothetical protein
MKYACNEHFPGMIIHTGHCWDKCLHGALLGQMLLYFFVSSSRRDFLMSRSRLVTFEVTSRLVLTCVSKCLGLIGLVLVF